MISPVEQVGIVGTMGCEAPRTRRDAISAWLIIFAIPCLGGFRCFARDGAGEQRETLEISLDRPKAGQSGRP